MKVGKLQENPKGFSAIEALLILVIVAIIGGTGWYIWHSRSNTDKTLTANSSSTSNFNKKGTPSKAPTQSTGPTADWASYSSPLGKFTLKYPKSWVVPTNPDLCISTAETGLFMIGPSAETAGKCGSDGFGQVTVTWRSDRQFCGDLNDNAWTQNSKETVTVAGTSAAKITAFAKAPGQGLGAVPEGTKNVQYCFVANNKTYIADYEQQPSYPDVLNDFNTLVTKTLTVSN
jgi:hypothetical protein